MSYIGRGTESISNVEVLDNLIFNGSASYTLQKSSVNFVPSSANNLLISISGVVQQGNFSVSGSTITFDTTVSASDTCDWILHYGTGLITTVADGTITEAKLGSNAVTTAKINDSAITNAKITDGTIANAKLANSSITLNGSAVPLGGSATVGGSNTPAFDVTRTSNQSFASNVYTKIQFNVEKFDTDNCFDSTTNYRFTPTEAGKYYLNATVLTESVSDNVHKFDIRIYKNGSYHKLVNIDGIGLSAYHVISQSISAIVEANGTSDYFEVYVSIKGDGGQTQGIEVDTARSLWFSGFKLVGA